MSYIKERVSYLKGLADGLKIDESSNEGKIIKAIIEVLDDVALNLEEVEDTQDELSEQVDSIDEDLSVVESVVFDKEGCDCCEEDDDLYVTEIECPYCNEEISVDEDMIDDEEGEIECPSCHKKIKVGWECECGCEGGHGDED